MEGNGIAGIGMRHNGQSGYGLDAGVVVMSRREVQEIVTNASQSAASTAVWRYHQQAFNTKIGHEVFRVPNNMIGRGIVFLLKRFLNRKVYRVVLRGRKPLDGGYRGRQSLPLGVSGQLAVYIYTKRGHE